VLTVPRSVLIDVSYASPTAKSGPPIYEHDAETGTVTAMLELYWADDTTG